MIAPRNVLRGFAACGVLGHLGHGGLRFLSEDPATSGDYRGNDARKYPWAEATEPGRCDLAARRVAPPQ